MKKIVVVAALVFGAATAQQAVACDWNQLHASTPSTVVVCDNGRCRAVDSATTQQAAEPETAPTVAEQPATPAPVTVADGSRND
jgi:hypothetical protein